MIFLLGQIIVRGMEKCFLCADYDFLIVILDELFFFCVSRSMLSSDGVHMSVIYVALCACRCWQRP